MFGLFHWFFSMISHCLSKICIKIDQFHFFKHHLTTFTFMPSPHSYDGFNWEAVISYHFIIVLLSYIYYNFDTSCKGVHDFFSHKENIFRDLFPFSLAVLLQLKDPLPKTNCNQIANPEWNGTNFRTHRRSMLLYTTTWLT